MKYENLHVYYEYTTCKNLKLFGDLYLVHRTPMPCGVGKSLYNLLVRQPIISIFLLNY